MCAAVQLDDEKILVDQLSALTVNEIKQFLRRKKLPTTGRKEQLRETVETALRKRKIAVKHLAAFLDEVTPWGKQHVFLYKGPAARNWRDESWVRDRLAKNDLLGLLNARAKSLVLPEELAIASIQWSKRRLRIVSVKKREGWLRDDEHDEDAELDDGRPVQMRAWVRQVLRGIVALEWDLVSGNAFLQITQLPSGMLYEKVAAEFATLVKPWLNLANFSLIDLRTLATRLFEQEEKGAGKAESHAFDFNRLGQRNVSARSTSSKVPLRGDPTVDNVMKMVRNDGGIPRIADFYWESNGELSDDGEPHSKRPHFVIVAEKGRLNFKTPNTEDGFRSVLTELRKLAR